MRAKLLQGSAGRAGRVTVNRQAAQWIKTRRRIRRRRDAEALHDFRVALRRLRSTLRAFRPFLDTPRGLRRRLRRLSRATNEGRNLEIWQGWVAQHGSGLGARQEEGVRWLRARLRAERRRVDERMQAEITRSVPRLRRELKAVRGHRGPKGIANPAAYPRTAAEAVRRVIWTGTTVLERRLGEVRSMDDRLPLHAARIAAKRLRYLLEPFAAELLDARRVLEQLEELQRLLGEVHDAHVFADALREALAEVSEQRARVRNQELLPWPGAGRPTGQPPSPGARSGLLALARRLRQDGERRFEQFRREWLVNTKAEFWDGLRRLGVS